MKVYRLLTLFAWEQVIAAWQPPNLLSSLPESSAAIASPATSLAVIGNIAFHPIIPNHRNLATKYGAASPRDIIKRQPTNPPKISAEEASTKSVPGGGKSGVFYRGDSRSPAEIFKTGFAPQGADKSLQNHLSFVGGSGLVSLSRSRKSAESYAFGRSAENNQKGYIYVMVPKDIPNGYWVPEIYPPNKNPAVGANQEFAVDGAVPPSSISYAYEVTREKPSSKSNKIRNNDYSLKSSLPCSTKKRAICDATNYSAKPYKSSKIRITKAVGKAAAITLLAPHARRLLEAIKQWDNPIGAAVNWLDNKIASLQELIGGPKRDDIDGNDLKAKLICALKGGQAKEIIAGRPNNICKPSSEKYADNLRRDFESGKLDRVIEMCKGISVYPGGHPAVWEWTKGYCAALHRTSEYAARMWELAVSGLLNSCSELEDNPPENEDLYDRLEEHCSKFQAEVDRAENPVAKPVASSVTVMKCKVSYLELRLEGAQVFLYKKGEY